MTSSTALTTSTDLSFNLRQVFDLAREVKELSDSKAIVALVDGLGLPAGERRAFGLFRLGWAFQQLWGEAYSEKRRLLLSGGKGDSFKALEKEMETYERLQNLCIAEHDRLLGSDGFFSRRKAQARTARILEAQGLATFHAEEMGRTVAKPIVAALDRQTEVSRIQTELLMEQLKMMKAAPAPAAPSLDLVGLMAQIEALGKAFESLGKAPAPEAPETKTA